MTFSNRFIVRNFQAACLCLIAFAVFSASLIAEEVKTSQEKIAAKKTTETKKKTDCNKGEKWISLFDGKTLTGWTKTKFGSEADVVVKDKTMILEMGAPLTGVTITEKAFKPLPKIDYEMFIQAKRHLGGDFFLALTFPVNDKHCSLVLGGWGGSVVGLSSIDSYDASENETTTYHQFKNGTWYDVRLKVTKKEILVWLDKEQVIKIDISDKKVSTRIEVELSHPIGLATFETTAHFRDFKMRSLPKKKQLSK